MYENRRRHTLPYPIQPRTLAPPSPEPQAEPSFRLILETVRRADKALFSHAAASASAPLLSFFVHPARVVVECNDETVFHGIYETPIDASESMYMSRYLESVFEVASSMSIQTHDTTVHLEPHSSGFKKVWSEPEVSRLPLGFSRMTINLRQLEGSTEAQVNLRSDLLQQLQEVQQICPLALQRLESLTVSFHDDAGVQVAFDALQVAECGNSILKVQRESRKGAVSTQQTRWYHVKRTRTLVGRLQTSNSTPTPIRSVAISLGFPLTTDGCPQLQNEEVFAPFSLGCKGFKVCRSPNSQLRTNNEQFVIQSDFETDGPGQAIKSSAYNIDLLDGISSAFVSAVRDLDHHPKLKYTWPRYLPQPEDIVDRFWLRLAERIFRDVCGTPVVRSLHRDDLRLIEDAKLPLCRGLDQHGNQLLDNRVLDPFVSEKYSDVDLAALRPYGLQALHMHEVLELVRTDLCSRNSMMKSEKTSQAWHSRVASLLSLSFLQQWSGNIPLLSQIPIIPRRDGCWTSAESGPMFWPTSHGMLIPSVSKARIVHEAAANNPERRRLFELLGVQEASISEVRSWIVDEYNSMRGVTLKECKGHLHFLYLTHAYRRRNEDLIQIGVLTRDYRVVKPSTSDVYFPGTSPFGPEALLAPLDDSRGASWGISTSFIHPLLLEDAPLPPSASHPSWTRWLADSLGVRDGIRLVSGNGGSISNAFLYIAERQPENLLGALAAVWPTQGSLVMGNAVLKDMVKEMLVPCQDGAMYPLWETYLPLPHLQQQCARYMADEDFFPFVDLGEDVCPENLGKWSFLVDDLGVSTTDGIGFLLDIIGYTREANPDGLSIERCQALVPVYCEIESRCAGHADPDGMAEIVR